MCERAASGVNVLKRRRRVEQMLAGGEVAAPVIAAARNRRSRPPARPPATRPSSPLSRACLVWFGGEEGSPYPGPPIWTVGIQDWIGVQMPEAGARLFGGHVLRLCNAGCCREF